MPAYASEGDARRCVRREVAHAPHGAAAVEPGRLRRLRREAADGQKVSSVKTVSTAARSNGHNYNVAGGQHVLRRRRLELAYTETLLLAPRLYPADYPGEIKYFHGRNWLIRPHYMVAIDPSEFFQNAIEGFPLWLRRHDEDARRLGPGGVLAIPTDGPFALGKLRFREAISRLEARFRDKPAEYVYLSDLLREVCIDTGVPIDTVFKLEGEALTKRTAPPAAAIAAIAERKKKTATAERPRRQRRRPARQRRQRRTTTTTTTTRR